MPLTSATVCNMSGFMVGFIAFVLLMSEILPLFSYNTLVVEEIWTAEDLSSMAGSSTMAAAVGYLTSVSARSRAFEREYDDIKAIIDGHTAENIRTALLTATDGESTDKFVKFARNTNAAATCSTAGTAGEHGLDVCLAGCQKKSFVLTWTPRKATCYMLCALATSPCTKDVAGTAPVRAVAWGTMAMDWTELPIFWITSVVNWLMALMWVIEWVVIVVATMAREMAMWGAVSMEGTTWEMAWTVMKVVFLLRIACEVRTKIRGARSHRCEMEKTLNVAQRELDELKLDQMFKTRKKLLNEDGLHPLHDLGAWVIDRGPVNGRRH